MAEIDFERRLERMFADAPALADDAAFAARVEGRLNTGWTARRWLIGAAGVVGGIIGASQLLMSNLFQKVENAQASARMITSDLRDLAPQGDWLSAFSGGGVVVWTATGLAIVAMGFVLTRVIEEF